MDTHSTENYYLGKGIMKFDRLDTDGLPTGMRDLGNCPDFTIDIAIEKLEHFSSREASKTKDKTVVLSKGGTAKFTLDEYAIENLALALYGTITGADQINILKASKIEGEIEFTGTNAIGPNFIARLWKVSINPTGGFPFIGDDWGKISVEAEIMADDTRPDNPYGIVYEIGES